MSDDTLKAVERSMGRIARQLGIYRSALEQIDAGKCPARTIASSALRKGDEIQKQLWNEDIPVLGKFRRIPMEGKIS